MNEFNVGDRVVVVGYVDDPQVDSPVGIAGVVVKNPFERSAFINVVLDKPIKDYSIDEFIGTEEEPVLFYTDELRPE